MIYDPISAESNIRIAGVAQLVEAKTLDLKVMGSSLTPDMRHTSAPPVLQTEISKAWGVQLAVGI